MFGLTCDSLPPARTPKKKCSENPPALRKLRANATLRNNSRACGALASFRLSLLTQREAQNCAAPASSPPPSVSSVFTFLLNSLNASNQALRVSPVYRASMRLAVCERTRRTPVTVLHSFLSGVTRAARRHVPLFIINEGKRRGNVQWEEKI